MIPEAPVAWLSLGGAVALWLIVDRIQQQFDFFQKLFIPPALTAGILINLILSFAPGMWPLEALGGLIVWPGFLINIVFANLLLERALPGRSQFGRAALLQNNYVWILALSQIGLGVLLNELILRPLWSTSPNFGHLIEVGFVGGHGTAAIVGEMTRDYFPDGLALGQFSATLGIVGGFLGGFFFLNLGRRRGWWSPESSAGNPSRENIHVELANSTRPRWSKEELPPWFTALLLVFLAVLLGWVLRNLLTAVAGGFLSTEIGNIIGTIPLFTFALVGGWFLRTVLSPRRKIPEKQLTRITSISLEILILCAVATLDFFVLWEQLAPFLILMIAGVALSMLIYYYGAPRLLPRENHRQLGIINFGMSTGVTALGLMFLHRVDPELETGAAEEYAAAIPLNAPFVGGGLLTMAVPGLLHAGNGIWVAAGCLVGLTFFIVLSRRLLK